MTSIRCEHCGCELFTLDSDGGLILHAGGFVRHVDGICRCGHGYHWSTTDRLLERMLERYNEKKVEIGKELAEWVA